MRTLSQIMDAVKENQPATEEELRYTLLAMDALSHWDRNFLIRFAGNDKPNVVRCELEANESFRRWKTALGAEPKTYVGWNNDPANPEYQRRRSIALKIADKALKGELPNQKRG